MIENIHSHEGEEKRYSGNVNYTFKPPKNIKQIGESTSQKKIYVEDYVFTYMKELAKKEYSDCRIAVLLGKYVKMPEEKIIVISGAVEAVGVHFDSENVFTNDTWTSIYETIKQYFHEVEVVGWFIGGPGFMLENVEKLRKIHLDNFAGVDKTMLKYDSMEGEEAFYIYEHGALCKQTGYYVYYDKNDDMQNYIMTHQAVEPQKTEEERREEVVQEYKEEVQEEKAQENGKSVMHLMYAAGSLMVVLVIVIAATIINNNNKLDQLESALNSITNQMNTEVAKGDGTNPAGEQGQSLSSSASSTSKTEGGSKETSATMNVETIPGTLDSVKGETVVGDQADPKGQKQSKDNANADNKKANASQAKPEQKKTDSTQGEKAKGTASQNKEGKENTQNSKKPQNPAKNKEEKEPAAKEASATTQAKYYEVQEGDTLASISYKLYNSPKNIKKIIDLNGIDDPDKIVAGQKLLVP